MGSLENYVWKQDRNQVSRNYSEPYPWYKFQSGLYPLLILTFLCSRCKAMGVRGSLPSSGTCLSVGYSVKRKGIS